MRLAWNGKGVKYPKVDYKRIIKAMRKQLFSVVIEKDNHGYAATCPSIQGCYSQGSTYEQVVANIKDAIKLCLADMSASGKKILSRNQSLLSLTAIEVAA
jgi:predicted RNase H-like HicB family nuclease